MRFYKAILFVLFSVCIGHLNSQTKSYGIGLSNAVYSGWNPGIPLTPYLFYQYKKHELHAGVELYDGQLGFTSIVGYEAEYRNHFYNVVSHFDLFTLCNFQYVQYAIGPARNVPFNYHNPISPELDYSMIQVRSFHNTLGAGIQYSCCKLLSLYFNGGLGYNYYRNNVSPGISATHVDNNSIGSGFKFIYMIKTGLAIKLIRSKD